MLDERFEELQRAQLPFLSPSEPLAVDASLRDLGLDSMATVELLAAVENTYDVRFLDEALNLSTFATPGTLWAALPSTLETV
jgi:acyl carrier protein